MCHSSRSIILSGKASMISKNRVIENCRMLMRAKSFGM